MKKISVIFLWLLVSANSTAQLPNGSIAPDFTVTDVNGNRHTLSNYLNAGKPVILEFSGVNCGHSWIYLRTEALQDFFNAYGSPGSNEATVLFIESSTTIDDLKNTGNLHFGNWLEGTPFPMVLDTGLHRLYQMNYVPCIYRICTDGKLINIGQPAASNISSLLNSACTQLAGVNNYGRLIGNVNGFCGKTGSFTTTLKNYGTNNITSATLLLKENDVVIGTKNFTGSVAQFSSVAITFDAVNINSSAAYTAELKDVNGTQNFNAAFSSADLPFSIATNTGKNLLVKTHTNKCPADMSWEITNSAGTIVGKSDSYGIPGVMCDYSNGGKVMEQNIVLPDTKDCYTLTLKAAGGYGWKNYGYDYVYQREVPGIEILSDGKTVFSKLEAGNFGSALQFENCITTKDSTDFPAITNPAPVVSVPVVFPNPSQGIIHVKSTAPVSIRIFNLMGLPVLYAQAVNNGAAIYLSRLAGGVYIIKITDSNNKTTLQKLVLNN